jgi:hypothetical protein
VHGTNYIYDGSLMPDIVRTGQLTLAQQSQWMRLSWRELGLPFRTTIRLWLPSEPVPLKTATNAWRVLVERHEILRTIFMAGPDGRPIQSVYDIDDFHMPVTTESVDDIEEFCYDKPVPLVASRAYMLLPPWHARLFVNGEHVHAVGLSVDHVVTDGIGVANWEQQFNDLCSGRPTRFPRFQPLDQKNSNGNEPKTTNDPIFKAPQNVVPGRLANVTGPRYFAIRAEHDGLVHSLDAIARRHKVTRPTVLMFAIAWLVARYGRQDHVFFVNLFANGKFGDGIIECRVLPVDVHVRIDESQLLGAALQSIFVAMLTAYGEAAKRGEWQFNYRSEAAAERGSGAINPIVFAYNGDTSPGSGEAIDVKTVLSESEQPTGEPFGTRIVLAALESTLVIEWVVDAAMFPREIVRELANGVPGVLARLLQYPELHVGSLNDLPLQVPCPADDCTLVRGDWVRLTSVDSLLRDCPGVVLGETDAVGHELVATVELKPGVVPFDVHEFMLSHLHQHADILAPHVYRIVRGTEVETWRPVDQTEPLAPVSRAERDLLAAINQTHGTAVADMATTYVGAGCRVLLAPTVIEILRRCGWTGARSHHFMSPFPLRAIARELVRIDEDDR